MREEREVDAAMRRVLDYRRHLNAALIAVKHHLDTPYPDDPRWTPWTRFVGPARANLSQTIDDLCEILASIDTGPPP